MPPSSPTPDETDIWDRVAARLDAFALAWENPDDPPAITDYLPGEENGEVREAALLELIKVDMECQWNLGVPKWVEDYLDDFAELGGVDNAPLDLIAQELSIRQNQGRQFNVDEYLDRFPNAGDGLLPLLQSSSVFASVNLEVDTLQQVCDAIATFQAGDEIDDFDLINELGAGSFATVFLAWQRSMQRWVALKLSAAIGDEPQTLAQLQHPFVVRVFDVRDIENGLLRLLYMEYVPGGTLQGICDRLKQMPQCDWSGKRLLRLLDETLQSRSVEPPQDSLNRRLLTAADWAETVCVVGSHLALAIAYAHQKGVLHRDIKPANILIDDAGFPKLADFNISFGSEVQGSTAAENFGGSMGYMSPEQLDAMHPDAKVQPEELDGTSDTYALALVLWEMLTGQRPFDSAPPDAERVEMVEFLAAARHDGVSQERQDAFPKDAPPALKPVLLQCLEPKPANRFNAATDVARQLLLCLHSDVQQLLWQAPTGWLRWPWRHPLVALLVCILAPTLFFSALNIAYNAYAAEDWAPPGLFDSQVTIINAVAYSVGLGVFLMLGVPAARMIRSTLYDGLPRPSEPSPTPGVDGLGRPSYIARVLQLAPYAALITLVLWTCCGFIFPVWTHVVVGQAQLSRYGHFFLSQVICGALAGLIVYFLITALATRVWIPTLLAPTQTCATTAELLRRLPRRARACSVVYALMPSLCLLLLSLGDLSLRFPFIMLGLIGAGGFIGILWLTRNIERDAAALRTAIAPEVAGAPSTERSDIFETAQAVWSSVRSS